ncbi:HAD family hydrolase [Paenibacillus eucommiae]|uniref:Hydrolase of the HAD superfamily n=1 Tax=Paenibacillus eucommiae TaxID=1355755 RepID=A0ABS4J6Y2_9BACL|nr:HAD family hydrolase [Paenibacillus eucommiae]MBP1995011.1 putative hydrolase of the HAD superfamily [Paenibacillus eucommiae]
MKEQTILFDLDDTLVHCNKYFDSVITQYVHSMLGWFSEYGVSFEDIRQKQLELDLIGVSQHGFMANRFPQSLVETYHYYSALYKRHTKRKEEDMLLQLGHTVYEYSAEPYPHMNETLETLKKSGHQLFLYTGGDISIQMKKVTDTGLDAYFQDRIFVTLHKTKEFMESLLLQHQFDRRQTWMIGNSARTDVLPALSAGIHSIYIPASQEWLYNTVDIDIEPKGAFFTLPSLRDVPEAIGEYTRNLPSSVI